MATLLEIGNDAYKNDQTTGSSHRSGDRWIPRHRGKDQPQFRFLNESLLTKYQLGLLLSLVLTGLAAVLWPGLGISKVSAPWTEVIDA